MIISVDMDGVVCTEERTFERSLARPLPGVKEAMQQLIDEGHTVVIYSSRGWPELRMTEDWLRSHGIPYHGIHLGKPVADRFIDDRAISFRDWDTALHQLSIGPTAHGVQDEEYLRILRDATKEVLLELVRSCERGSTVLEVGPMTHHSKVFERMQDTYVDTRALFTEHGCRYLSMDIDPTSGADIVGDFLNANQLLGGRCFDTVVMASCLEHMPRFWEVPRVLKELLSHRGKAHILTPWNIRFHGPRPDCWRISDDGYRALFADELSIVSLHKIPCANRPLMPIGLYCVVQKG